MTTMAPSEVLRCPECQKLVLRYRFSTINMSGELFNKVFHSMNSGQLSCPHCETVVDANALPVLEILDAKWKRGVWAGIEPLNSVSVETSEI